MRACLIVLSLVGVACSAEMRERPSFDLNGDGRDELLVRQSWDGRVRTLAVDGTLGDTVLETALTETVVRVGDVNGDGLDDLAVRAPSEDDEQVRVHLGRADGTAGPIPFFVLEVDGWLRNVKAAGDVDGDGLDDLIAVGLDGPSFVMHGDPSAPVVSEPLDFDGEVHAQIDLDGDGRMDLLSNAFDHEELRNEDRVLLGGSDALIRVRSVGAHVGSIPDPNDARRDVMVGGVALGDRVVVTGAARWTSGGFVLVDMPVPGVPVGRGQVLGDDRIDSLFRVIESDDETCDTAIGSPWRPLGAVVGTAGGCGTITVAVPGDLDYDGFDEVLEWIWATDGSRGLRIHHGGHEVLTEGASVLPVIEEAYQPLAYALLFGAGDVDGDDRADLVGFGTDRCPVIVRGSPDPLRTETSCDWVALYHSPWPTSVGDQDGRAGDEIMVPGVGLVTFGSGAPQLLGGPADLLPLPAVGDIDGDGFVDLIGRTLFDEHVYAGGPGALSDEPVVLDLGGTPDAVRLGDVNGDGIDDVVVDSGIRFGGPDVTTRPNDVDLTPLVGEYGWRIVPVGDHNDDGVTDVGVLLFPDRVTVFLTVQDGTLVELGRLEYGTTEFFDDVDGDGRAEHHWQDQVVMSATGARITVGWNVYGAGDLDGDGVPELIVDAFDAARVLRWNGSSFDEVVVEHRIPADEFVLSAVL